jgi:hypothetical protein
MELLLLAALLLLLSPTAALPALVPAANVPEQITINKMTVVAGFNGNRSLFTT